MFTVKGKRRGSAGPASRNSPALTMYQQTQQRYHTNSPQQQPPGRPQRRSGPLHPGTLPRRQPGGPPRAEASERATRTAPQLRRGGRRPRTAPSGVTGAERLPAPERASGFPGKVAASPPRATESAAPVRAPEPPRAAPGPVARTEVRRSFPRVPRANVLGRAGLRFPNFLRAGLGGAAARSGAVRPAPGSAARVGEGRQSPDFLVDGGAGKRRSGGQKVRGGQRGAALGAPGLALPPRPPPGDHLAAAFDSSAGVPAPLCS